MILTSLVILVSLIMCLSGVFTLIWMLYAWENPDKAEQDQLADKHQPPQYSFTALVPARHEEKVISDTIQAIDRINYPEKLKEIIVICRGDDPETINKAQAIIDRLNKHNIRLKIFSDLPINKPHGLNIGLGEAKNSIVTVFDAEDEPHPEIYNIINTVFVRNQVDIVQAGVQLMNFRSHWFSAINVLEYFFWFKSGLPFFSRFGQVTPLGGNTVFFKKSFLTKIGGWDENCLTEDADIGIRAVVARARVKVVYDEASVTREETPDSINSFIRQRTRWNQGFLQILGKGDWQKLPLTRQKIMAVYTLASPLLQIIYVMYLPFGLWVAVNYKLPVLAAFFSFVPTYIFLMQVSVYCVGIREFARRYRLDYSIYDSVKILVTFFPYQVLLVAAAVRAIGRFTLGNAGWEKTYHTNCHRLTIGTAKLSYAH